MKSSMFTGWIFMVLEAGGWRLEAGGWRLEAGGDVSKLLSSCISALPWCLFHDSTNSQGHDWRRRPDSTSSHTKLFNV